jgi:hypothetical protein
VSVDVAAIHHSFALGDLRYAAEYIRRRWPDALILVIGDQAKYLDDPLYDDWASGEISPEELLGHIDRLLAARRRIRKSDRPWLGGVRQ